MAFHKLPLSLFSAKAGVVQTVGSTQYFHFLAGIRQDRNQYAFVCESQPLLTLTLTGHGLPQAVPSL